MAGELPLVSVLMTAYNRENYIAEAIESVLASTYDNFELIIVDDGSKDSTVEIARSYEAGDSRVRVYINEKNLGDYPNRNKAASYANGKYIKYLDSDDYIYPWGLELLVQMMERFPGAGWGLCSLEQYKDKPFPFLLTPAEAYRYHYFGPGLFHKAPLSSIIKKDTFDSVRGFSPMRMVGDFEMWHRLALNVDVVLMPGGMVWAREHEQQEVRDRSRYQFVYLDIQNRFLSNQDCPLTAVERHQVLKKSKIILAKFFLKGLLRLNFNEARSAMSHLLKWM